MGKAVPGHRAYDVAARQLTLMMESRTNVPCAAGDDDGDTVLIALMRESSLYTTMRNLSEKVIRDQRRAAFHLWASTVGPLSRSARHLYGELDFIHPVRLMQYTNKKALEAEQRRKRKSEDGKSVK